jgi:type III secretory pathway lipoprotein EscJ
LFSNWGGVCFAGIASAIVLTNTNNTSETKTNWSPISLSTYNDYFIDRKFSTAPSEAAVKSSLKTLIKDNSYASINPDDVDVTIDNGEQSVTVSPKPNNVLYSPGVNAKIFYEVRSTAQQFYVEGTTTLSPQDVSALVPGGLTSGAGIS